MRVFVWLTLVVAFVLGCSRASTTSAPVATGPFLWSVTKDGKTSYLFGSMHAGVDSDQLPKIVFDKLDSEPAFAMEADLEAPEMRHFGERTSGSLHEDLGPADMKKLEEVLGEDTVRAVDGRKPVIAAMYVSLHGLPHTEAMDGVLLARAQREHKRTEYLEPAAVQIAMLEKLFDAHELHLMLDDIPGGEAVTREMLASYLAGDADRMLAASQKERDNALAHGHTAAEYDAAQEQLLYGRNAAWIPTIERLHAAGGAFIVVGTLHLLGPRSVPDLLTKRGYTVARVVN